MRIRLSVLIALMSFTLGLVRPHSCPAAPAAPAGSDEACHQTDAPASSDAADCDSTCKKACQPSLLLTSPLPAAGLSLPALDVAPVSPARTLPLLAHAIDHIPLA